MSDFNAKEDMNNSLQHHGIKNQKWGVRHGPPYPLSKQEHSAVVTGKINRKDIAKKAAEKRRKKILHDPKKLYKHADEFTKEEIDNAVEKIKSMQNVKNLYDKPKSNNNKRQKEQEKKEKKINKRVNKYARNIDDLRKNMKKLSPDEIDAAIRKLDQNEEIFNHKMNQIDKPRKTVDEIVRYLQTVKKLGKTVFGMFEDDAVTKVRVMDDYYERRKKADRYYTLPTNRYEPGNKSNNKKKKRSYDSGAAQTFTPREIEFFSQPVSAVKDETVELLRKLLGGEIEHSDITMMGREELENYIAHHGIKNQKWGVRHGPPYPLDSSTHRKVVKNTEKKSNVKKSEDDSSAALSMLLLYAGGAALGLGAAAAKIAIDKAVNKSNEKKIDKLINEKNNAENVKIDKKTGLRLKDGESSMKEDLKAVNPTYSAAGSNSNNNCGYCAFAYEMRRRGFDVIAKLSSSGISSTEYYKIFPTAKPKVMDPYGVTVLNKNGIPTGFNDVKNMNKARIFKMNNTIKLKRQFSELSKEEGSRGLLSIQWYENGGHATTYFVEDGKVHIADPQTRKILVFNSSYLDHAMCVTAIRTDNIKTEDINIEEIKRFIQ